LLQYSESVRGLLHRQIGRYPLVDEATLRYAKWFVGLKNLGHDDGVESNGRDYSRATSISWSRVMVAIGVGLTAALVMHYLWPLISN